jgi:hypothetical protein
MNRKERGGNDLLSVLTRQQKLHQPKIANAPSVVQPVGLPVSREIQESIDGHLLVIIDHELSLVSLWNRVRHVAILVQAGSLAEPEEHIIIINKES